MEIIELNPQTFGLILNGLLSPVKMEILIAIMKEHQEDQGQERRDLKELIIDL
jgi:hypothetical protein